MPQLKVFISWSGDKSRSIAESIRDWLPDVVKDAHPWLSSEDLRKGLQWIPELSKQLASSSMGILVITDDNKDAPWLVFEAGVLWKAMPDKHCCPIVCDLQPTDLRGPLASFNATTLAEQDMYRLVQTMNAACGDSAVEEARLKRWFDQNWSVFDKRVREIQSATPSNPSVNKPDERELLEEILSTVRSIAREPSSPSRESTDVIRPLRDFLASISTGEQERILSEILNRQTTHDPRSIREFVNLLAKSDGSSAVDRFLTLVNEGIHPKVAYDRIATEVQGSGALEELMSRFGPDAVKRYKSLAATMPHEHALRQTYTWAEKTLGKRKS